MQLNLVYLLIINDVGYSLVNRAEMPNPSRNREIEGFQTGHSTVRRRSRSPSPSYNQSARHTRNYERRPRIQSDLSEFHESDSNLTRPYLRSGVAAEFERRRARSRRFGLAFDEERELSKLNKQYPNSRECTVAGIPNEGIKDRDVFQQHHHVQNQEEEEYRARRTKDEFHNRGAIAISEPFSTNRYRPQDSPCKSKSVIDMRDIAEYEAEFGKLERPCGTARFDQQRLKRSPSTIENTMHPARRAFLRSNEDLHEDFDHKAPTLIDNPTLYYEENANQVKEKADAIDKKIEEKYGTVSTKRGFIYPPTADNPAEGQPTITGVGRRYEVDIPKLTGISRVECHDSQPPTSAIVAQPSCRRPAAHNDLPSPIQDRGRVSFRVKHMQITDFVPSNRLESQFFPDVPLHVPLEPLPPLVGLVEATEASFAERPTPTTESWIGTVSSCESVTTTTMALKKSPFDILSCARPNIIALQPYRCARECVLLTSSNSSCAES